MNMLKEPWLSAAQQKGIASYNAIARASGVSVETVRQVTLGRRRPTPVTAERLAKALGVAPHTIDEWAGASPAGINKPYTPPQEASRLTRRQRKAVDYMIMALVDPRGREEASREQVTKRAPDSPPQNLYDLAAHPRLETAEAYERKAGESRGEESQEFP